VAEARTEALVKLLSDTRLAVVERAVAQLAAVGAAAVPQLRALVESREAPAARQQALWALSRIAGEEARAAVRNALADPAPEVQLAAAKIAGLWRDAAALPQLVKLLGDGAPSAELSRTAAEALGRIGKPEAVPALFSIAAASAADRFLEHAAIFALIEIADPKAVSPYLAESGSTAVRRAALIALDQMDGSPLSAEVVVPLLTSTDSQLRETATWIVNQRRDWGAALAAFLRERLSAELPDGHDAEELERMLARFSQDSSVQELLAGTVRAGSPAARLRALRAMAQADLRSVPEAWQVEVSRTLEKGDSSSLPAAVQAARTFTGKKGGAPQTTAALLRLGSDDSRPAELRLNALSALPIRSARARRRSVLFPPGAAPARTTACRPHRSAGDPRAR
jgi:hypothetical protein